MHFDLSEVWGGAGIGLSCALPSFVLGRIWKSSACFACSSIWGARNLLVHERSVLLSLEIVSSASRSLGLFQGCGVATTLIGPCIFRCNRWESPPSGDLKLNVDAAVQEGGWFYWDWGSKCIALRKGIEFVLACNLRVAWVESDSSNVIQAIGDPSFEGPEAVVIHDMKSLLANCGGGMCDRVPPEKNMVPHLLASIGLCSFSDFVGTEAVPFSISDVIQADLASS
ncbi:hypothetical protein TIFTF001_006245 [Ficus carica]|uniref:RNase H type-1 domain-containing protein n=1 Tax=Ficus carica TaxID=3494 RepID=A0AA87ZIF7_FICCA|nr:hypothetical protein TIFTF001_006245 [Ficus carica]